VATIKGRCASGTGEAVRLPRVAEREVTDLLPMEADPADARGVLESLPFWFHTFALNPAAGLYPPGVARDHRYRNPGSLPGSGAPVAYLSPNRRRLINLRRDRRHIQPIPTLAGQAECRR
jgi:hypothetical protein